MTLIIFIIVLGVLIFVHELGHFLMAKRAGIKVDEFALGFPPKIYSYKPKNSETEYVLNFIPFGGYVKIYGENGEEENLESYEATRSMGTKSWIWQVGVLSGGVIFNWIFAWILFSIALGVGTNVAIDAENEQYAQNQRLLVTSIHAQSPVVQKGIAVGDSIVSINGEDVLEPARFINIVRTSKHVDIVYQKPDSSTSSIRVSPVTGIVPGTQAIGVGVEKVGTVAYPFVESIQKGGEYTILTTKIMAIGLWDLLSRSFRGDASLNELSGPIGIAKMSGEAASQGLPTLLSFAGLLSVNLAVLNSIPFPALDGGRIIITLIEAIRRKRFSLATLQWVNGIGFSLLILLMIVITFGDIRTLF